MKVIFVGVHNKEGLMPLDPISRSGKVISEIIKRLPHDCMRTNLFDLDEMPLTHEIKQVACEWFDRVPCNFDDVIVLLGDIVHRNFKNIYNNKVIKLPHPASTFYSGKKNAEYVDRAVREINSLLTDNK